MSWTDLEQRCLLQLAWTVSLGFQDRVRAQMGSSRKQTLRCKFAHREYIVVCAQDQHTRRKSEGDIGLQYHTIGYSAAGMALQSYPELA